MGAEISKLSATHNVINLLQVTDTHLFATAEKNLLGVNTQLSYRRVIDAILQNQQPFDAVLATGDISQDNTIASYQYFAEHIHRLAKPCYWLPGNHDNIPLMVAALHDAGVQADKHKVIGDWQIILLDSQLSGSPAGYLSPEQLTLLDTQLSCYPDKHALVVLHHNVYPVGCKWLDQHILRNSVDFLAILAKHPQAKHVLFGHVHQQLDDVYDGVTYMASPSTCFQFKPACDDFTLDDRAPGWRYLQLHADGSVTTQVWRLSNNDFNPDLQSTGY
ncbi:MAG: Icc protein [Moritella sp.]